MLSRKKADYEEIRYPHRCYTYRLYMCIYDICWGNVGDEISEDPATYLKGSTVPWNVKLDFSSVDTKKAGTYDVIVSQPGYTYTFQIMIE